MDTQAPCLILQLHADLLKSIFRDVQHERTILRWVCGRFRDVFSEARNTWFPYHARGFTLSCLTKGYLELYDWAISQGAPKPNMYNYIATYRVDTEQPMPEHAAWCLIGGKDGLQRELYRSNLFSNAYQGYVEIIGKFAAACGYISILEHIKKFDGDEWYNCAYSMYVVACEAECGASFVWLHKKCNMKYAHRPYKNLPMHEHVRLRVALHRWASRLGFESQNKNEEGRCATTENWLVRQFSESEKLPAKRAPSWMRDPPAKRVTRSMTSN
jgi:hypothetical protein